MYNVVYRYICIFTLVIFIYGCDILYGVRQTAIVDHPVDHICVENVITTIPEIENFRFYDNEPKTSYGLYSGKTITDYDQYTFRGKDLWGSISIATDDDRKSFVTLDSTAMGSPPPQSIIDNARILFKKIRKELEDKCHGYPHAEDYVEYCMDVKCL